MEITDFIIKLRACKGLCKETGGFSLRCIVNPEHTEFKLLDENGEGVKAYFIHERKLTIFDAGMLYALWFKNRKPRDYASYHKCLAGHEFIANLIKVNLMASTNHIIEMEAV